jgi:hypothetical protein
MRNSLFKCKKYKHLMNRTLVRRAALCRVPKRTESSQDARSAPEPT